MDDEVWLAANSGNGLEIAEQYIAEANSAYAEPLRAISRYLLAIDVMQIHLGRMDAAAQLASMTFNDPKSPRT